MSRTPVALLICALAAGALGCSNDHALSVRGAVVSETRGAFTFDQDYRLDSPPEGFGSVFTGECEMARVGGTDAEPVWGVVATIRRGNDIDDLGLASVTVMQRTDQDAADGRVEATFGVTEFTSANGATCNLEIPYLDDGSGGMVGVMGDCEVGDGNGATEQLTITLDLTGCTVID